MFNSFMIEVFNHRKASRRFTVSFFASMRILRCETSAASCSCRSSSLGFWQELARRHQRVRREEVSNHYLPCRALNQNYWRRRRCDSCQPQAQSEHSNLPATVQASCLKKGLPESAREISARLGGLIGKRIPGKSQPVQLRR